MLQDLGKMIIGSVVATKIGEAVLPAFFPAKNPQQAQARQAPQQKPAFDADVVSFFDERTNLRCFYPSVKLEVLRILRAARAFQADDSGTLVSLGYDATGNPVPYAETAEKWVLDLNERCLILAPIYVIANTSVRKFLRASYMSRAPIFATGRDHYAVLFFVGEAKRVLSQREPKVPIPLSRVQAPPTVVVPTREAVAETTAPEEVTSTEAIEHASPAAAE